MGKLTAVLLLAIMALGAEPAKAPEPVRLSDKQKLELYRLMLDASTAEITAKRKADIVQGKVNELSYFCGAALMRNKDGDWDCPERAK